MVRGCMYAQGAIGLWVEDDVPDCLLPSEPLPGVVVSERSYEGLGAVELTLGNGMRVCIKSTGAEYRV